MTFYQVSNLTERLNLSVFSLFLFHISWKYFAASFILASKLNFVNLLKSRVGIKLVVLRVPLVARLAISGLLFSISVGSLLRAAEVTKPVILSIFL